MAEANIPYTFTNGVGNTIDATEVNANFQNLEDAVNDIDTTQFSSTLAKYFPTTVVTSLPGTPIDGQTVLYQGAGMATDGIVWMLRYNSSSASSYKWEFVGGAPWMQGISTSEALSSTSYTNLATTGPTVTAPLAGDYIVRLGAYVGLSNDNTTALMSFAVGGTGAADADAIASTAVGTGGVTGVVVSRDVQKTVSAAATAIAAKYRVTANSASFENRFLSIVPVRVG